MSLTSQITLNHPSPVPVPPFTFPGLFRGRRTGALWLARSVTDAVRITPGYQPHQKVGDRMRVIDPAYGYGVCHARFEQVTTPVTITFNP